MVEGDNVHRIVSNQRKYIKGRRFKAVSPNGKFTDGAAAIDGKMLFRIEVIGKNLFHFYSDKALGMGEVVVVRIHFGMDGRFMRYRAKPAENIPGAYTKTHCFPVTLTYSHQPPIPPARIKGHDQSRALQ